ncbi:transketolase [Novosphingobium chloroacetimidivorans]|uniref:Transketolase n=1 Tax=Novosphingobium chloroacetimidivorans TaxID=1428314 RepID=A0A7W7NX65_9SPHN|nr:transketolase [Novosphingobium chloroacetimidivorans]MBB4859099.1 transketolase [Novosphingobium chloroacetimidivorans]
MSTDPTRFAPMANAIRALSMDAVQAANSGHPGMPMGMADVATVLFSEFLRFDPKRPDWADRDRFVLSAGHGSMLIYSLLYLTGYDSPTIEDIRNFRQMGSVCAGHPENFLIPGIECTTGPLGQGMAMAVGMAIAERHLNATFGDDLVDHNTWVIAGDGCLMEGINHEAIGLAGTLKLGRLKVLWDDNRITIDGDTSLSTTEDIAARYKASGWDVFHCDGHDYADIERALAEAELSEKPSLVACRTIIGKGAPNKQGGHDVHGAPLGADEIAAARAGLGWTAEPFVIPEDVLADWRAVGAKGADARAEWEARVAADPQAPEFQRRMAGDLPNVDAARAALQGWLSGDANIATRKASENVLNVLVPAIPELIGGSADLTGSNNTKAKNQAPLTAEDYAGRYVYYGIREFGMAAAMNGMALHGGVIPYGGTFLIFSDYCRNAIRLSALQQTRVVYVLTHDSIGLGEDGPTHQPVEHIMSMRLIPNLNVFRPADVIETAEAWQIALDTPNTPSVLALSRQNLPQLRHADHPAGELPTARGAYRLRSAKAARRVILMATGSEVQVAVEVAERLESQGIGADVISAPCLDLFEQQDEGYKRELLPDVDPSQILRVSIEAGVTWGWERYTMVNGLNIGIDRFGASAPAKDLFARFGFTADSIVPKILDKLST